MSVIDEVLKANEQYLAAHHPHAFSPVPSKHLAVLTCMDTRLTLRAMGLQDGDAHVIRNAGEAIGRDGEIGVTLRDGTLSVTDTGRDIPDSVRADLFTPFFSTKRNGRGLGLVIVQEILANHGFGYSLENRTGGGAEFRVALRQSEVR